MMIFKLLFSLPIIPIYFSFMVFITVYFYFFSLILYLMYYIINEEKAKDSVDFMLELWKLPIVECWCLWDRIFYDRK